MPVGSGDGIVGMGDNEDDGRQRLASSVQLVQHLYTRELRHIDIQQKNVIEVALSFSDASIASPAAAKYSTSFLALRMLARELCALGHAALFQQRITEGLPTVLEEIEPPVASVSFISGIT